MLTGDALSAFKRDNWRRQIKLFPEAINCAEYAIPKRILLELAGNNLVESRLVNSNYEVKFGPLTLDGLAEQSMLMLQSLECHIDAAEELIRQEFSFIPTWQIDDVMASIGSDGSSCGPHFDRYDVFLLQLAGEKTWRLDKGEHSEADLRDNTMLRLLEMFEPTMSLSCAPGDVLYVPPGFGHHGISEGESITLSVGIRNPTMIELMADISEFFLLESDLAPLETELKQRGAKVDSRVVLPMIQHVISPRNLDTWYGCYSTRLRNPDVLDSLKTRTGPLDVTAVVDRHVETNIAANLPTRLAWTEFDQEVILFVNGDYYLFDSADHSWIVGFCNTRNFKLNPSNNTQLEMTLELLETGAARLI